MKAAVFIFLLVGHLGLRAQKEAHGGLQKESPHHIAAHDSAHHKPTLSVYATTAPDACTRITHCYYSIGYNPAAREPAWVYYHLTRARLDSALLARKGRFVADPETSDLQGNDKDYAGSSFDKGHMVPCEDMSFDEVAMKETFYYSNCVPQTSKLNRGQWKNLEQLVRNWTMDNDALDVIAGPVIERGLKRLGKSRVAIPVRCYKVVLDYQSAPPKAIAFVMPNQDQALAPVQAYACSIDEVEALTGIDFFPELPDELEHTLESQCDTTPWNWQVSRKADSFPPPKPVAGSHEQEHVSSVQCSATTKKGERCKRHTLSPNGKCSQHGGN